MYLSGYIRCLYFFVFSCILCISHILLYPSQDQGGVTIMYLSGYIQLGTSSRAIHGGAYFSAVSGRKFDLKPVLRSC